MKKLIELIRELDLNQTDKHTCHAYIEHFYQDFFEPYRDKELNILEIGKTSNIHNTMQCKNNRLL